MAILYDHDTQPRPDNKPSENGSANMGALAPIHTLELKVKAPPKPEPYRPANAGRLALRPDRTIIRHLTIQCLNEGITLTHWFEREALAYLKKNAPTDKTMGAQAPQIDRLTKIIDLNPSSISNIFKFWVGAFNSCRHGFKPFREAEWTSRDRTTAEFFSDIRIEIVELAMITVLDRWRHSTRSVRSLAFFREEILAQDVDYTDTDTVNIVVRLHHERAKLAKLLRVQPPPVTPEHAKTLKMINSTLDDKRKL
jgi:hypothetical protein